MNCVELAGLGLRLDKNTKECMNCGIVYNHHRSKQYSKCPLCKAKNVINNSSEYIEGVLNINIEEFK